MSDGVAPRNELSQRHQFVCDIGRMKIWTYHHAASTVSSYDNPIVEAFTGINFPSLHAINFLTVIHRNRLTWAILCTLFTYAAKIKDRWIISRYINNPIRPISPNPAALAVFIIKQSSHNRLSCWWQGFSRLGRRVGFKGRSNRNRGIGGGGGGLQYWRRRRHGCDDAH